MAAPRGLLALFAVAVFGERVGPVDAIGIALIATGIALLSRIA